MEEAKAKQAGRLAKLGGLEESLSTQDTITDAPAQSAVDILVRARSAEAADGSANAKIAASRRTMRVMLSAPDQKGETALKKRDSQPGLLDCCTAPLPL